MNKQRCCNTRHRQICQYL